LALAAKHSRKKSPKGAFFYLFRELVQIIFILSDNVRILSSVEIGQHLKSVTILECAVT